MSNILILQYTHNGGDLRAVSDNMYRHLIDCVRLLRARGYHNIRLKLHPGPDKWKISYFCEITKYFSVECPMMKFEPFSDCLEWADIVIGPIQTGAMFETLAAGKPYHGFLMPPHSMSAEYYSSYPILSSVDELPEALERRHEAEAAALMDDLCAAREYANGPKRIWDVLHSDFARSQAK